MKNHILLATLSIALLLACSRSTEAKRADHTAANETTTGREEAPDQPAPPATGDFKANLDEDKNQENAKDSWANRVMPTAAFDVAKTDTTTTAPSAGEAMSSSAAKVNGTDTLHRFVRTADLRFRVKDAVKATLGIEDLVAAHNGWVVSTTLNSAPIGTNIIPVSEDSSLEVSRYEMTNDIVLRVPNTELDSTIHALGRWVDLLDHRTINAQDIKLDMMRNAMATRRAMAHSHRLANDIDEQGKKLRDSESAEESLENTQQRADEARLNNLDLADRVAFSTVHLSLYQRPIIHRELIANDRNIEGYQPSLPSRIGAALKEGWRMLEGLVLGLIGIWPLLVVVVLGVFLWRKAHGKKKTLPTVQ